MFTGQMSFHFWKGFHHYFRFTIFTVKFFTSKKMNIKIFFIFSPISTKSTVIVTWVYSLKVHFQTQVIMGKKFTIVTKDVWFTLINVFKIINFDVILILHKAVHIYIELNFDEGICSLIQKDSSFHCIKNGNKV